MGEPRTVWQAVWRGSLSAKGARLLIVMMMLMPVFIPVTFLLLLAPAVTCRGAWLKKPAWLWRGFALLSLIPLALLMTEAMLTIGAVPTEPAVSMDDLEAWMQAEQGPDFMALWCVALVKGMVWLLPLAAITTAHTVWTRRRAKAHPRDSLHVP
jgi:4-amino-4-deoxy-L-arabinose transferase-like glycosyltransferase